MAGKKVVVIGAGLGGMTAAILLAQKGFTVTLFEKNEQVGGKLNVLEERGFKFDLGPSILTLPHIFEPVFAHDGKGFADYVPMVRVDPQWRNFFEDGTIVDLWESTERMREELARFGPGTFEEYAKFVAFAKQQYDIVDRGYFAKGLDTFWDFVRFYGWRDAKGLDYMGTMSGGIYKRVKNPYLRDIFEYFIKYVGSSAVDSPGFMNLMPNIQLEFGLWYVKGGLYGLAKGFQKRLDETGVNVRLKHEVTRIEKQGRRVVAVEVKDSDGKAQRIDADYVVSNMEVIPALQRLLGEPAGVVKRYEKFEPACSGIVVHLGLDRVYPQLAHHNFFYSRDQHAHFDRVFQQHKLPDDPTIYLVAPTRTDPSQAPAGHDNIKILPHIPYIQDAEPHTHEDYVALKELCLDKLERMGLSDLRKHIVVEDFWTPLDIEKKYYSNKGAIYGVVSDRRRNFAFKAPKQSREYENLFFVGGSVNPGGGMPMVTLSGQHVARMVAEAEQKRDRQ